MLRSPLKTARRRLLVPVPKVHDLSALNERLLARCLERLDALEARPRPRAVRRQPRGRRVAPRAGPVCGLRGKPRAEPVVHLYTAVLAHYCADIDTVRDEHCAER